MRPIDESLAAVEAAAIGEAQVWAGDAVLDATVPKPHRRAEALHAVARVPAEPLPLLVLVGRVQ
jgi:hypothetical protein